MGIFLDVEMRVPFNMTKGCYILKLIKTKDITLQNKFKKSTVNITLQQLVKPLSLFLPLTSPESWDTSWPGPCP